MNLAPLECVPIVHLTWRHTCGFESSADQSRGACAARLARGLAALGLVLADGAADAAGGRLLGAGPAHALGALGGALAPGVEALRARHALEGAVAGVLLLGALIARVRRRALVAVVVNRSAGRAV